MLASDRGKRAPADRGRRRFLGGTAALSLPLVLPGCDWVIRDPKAAPAAAIDIHTHIFNGRDVPVAGFLTQVVLAEGHGQSGLPAPLMPFLLLLKRILLTGTPTAAEELRGTADAKALRAAPLSPEAQDEAAVAEGLAALAAGDLGRDPVFDRKLGGGKAGDKLRPDDRAEGAALLDAIAADLGAGGAKARAGAGLADPQAEAQALAAEAFRKRGPGYVHNTPLIARLRWAGLLTRSRAQILDRLVSLYGRENGMRIYAPSLVDMGRWFTTREEVSPLADQIEVFSALARRRKDVLILPFVPFCPLRAAEELRADPSADILRHVRLAITRKGFCGVKLYPPMGFRPFGNRGRVTWAADPRFGDAAQMDRPLAMLYDWCAANAVPLKAHANDSMGAGPGTGAYADPAGWRQVLDRPAWAGLHLNLAHFGGFEETGGKSPGPDWEDTLLAMLPRYPGLYFDLSYWTEASDPKQRERVTDRMQALLAAQPGMVDRMMYGSDWSMLGQEPGHEAYLDRTIATLEGLGLDPARMRAVMGGNAARYLGLDRDGPQRSRLDDFYRDNPIYARSFHS